MSRPVARPPTVVGSPPVPDPYRLDVDTYLDLRHPAFTWFEVLGLIRADGGEVVIEPGALDMILALAGLYPVEFEDAGAQDGAVGP